MVDLCLLGLYLRKEVAEHEEVKKEAQSTEGLSPKEAAGKGSPLHAGNVGDDGGPATCYGFAGGGCP